MNCQNRFKVCDSFCKYSKKLGRKYRSIKSDIMLVQNVIARNADTARERLQLGEHGGKDLEVYKLRMLNSDIQKGKRSGYRLFYQITNKEVIFLMIYSKSDVDDFSRKEIVELIKQESELTDKESFLGSLN